MSGLPSAATSLTSSNSNSLPEDIFTYNHDQFYAFVRQSCGNDLAELLKFQSIRSASHLLRTSKEDILAVFQQESSQLGELKKLCCFSVVGDKHEVKLGVKLAIDSFLRSLKIKQDENKKKLKYESGQRQSASSATIPVIEPDDRPEPASSAILPSELPPTSTQDTVSSLPTQNIDQTSSLLLSSTALSTSNPLPIKRSKLNRVGHHSDIVQRITTWWNEYNDNPNLLLKEDIAYFLRISKQGSNTYSCALSCKCGARFQLPLLKSGLFKLSSFYRHLKEKRCVKTTNTVRFFSRLKSHWYFLI